jgi:hypothetical protein
MYVLRTIALKSAEGVCGGWWCIGLRVVVARDVVAEHVFLVPSDEVLRCRRLGSTAAALDGGPVGAAALELLRERDKASSGGGGGYGHATARGTFYIKCREKCVLCVFI